MLKTEAKSTSIAEPKKSLSHAVYHNLGTVPRLKIMTQQPNSTPTTYYGDDVSWTNLISHATSSTTTQILYSDSSFYLRAVNEDRLITKLQIGFRPATRTWTSAGQYANQFSYLSAPSGGTQTSYATTVQVDNTAIGYAYLVGYIVKKDPTHHWLRGGYATQSAAVASYNIRPTPGVPGNTILPNRPTTQGGTPLYYTHTHDDVRAFEGLDPAITLSTIYNHSNNVGVVVPTRRGPLGIAAPPYLPPALTTPQTAPDSDLIGQWRGTSTTMQNWTPMANGFDTGMFLSGYHWRSGGETQPRIQLFSDPSNYPAADIENARFTMQYVAGDSTFMENILEYCVAPGTTELEVSIHLPKGMGMFFTPSVRPSHGISNGNPSTSNTGYDFSQLDPLFQNLQQEPINPGPIPSNSNMTILPPLNAVGAMTLPFIMSTNSTKVQPIVQTGFTRTICDVPFNDGADMLKYQLYDVYQSWTFMQSAGYSPGPSEVIGEMAYPTMSLAVIFH